jgi:periplasmic protein TonB
MGCASLCHAQAKKAAPEQTPAPPFARHEPQVWKEFSSAEGGFSVLMPGTPKATAREIESPPGNVTFRSFELRTSTGVYDVSYSDLPIYAEDPAIIREGLDANRDELLKSEGLKLLTEEEIDFEGIPAREWLMLGSEGVIRRRLILMKDRLYTLTFVTAPSMAFKTGQPGTDPAARTSLYEETAIKFFDSFKVSPRQPAANVRRVEDESAARGQARRSAGGTGPATPGDVSAPPGAGPTRGEVDRILKELRGKNEVIIGDCAGGAKCPPLPDAGGVNEENKDRLKNGSLISKPQPVYPPIAKAARAQGVVTVQVLVGEDGKVIAAQAASGHPLLQAASVAAARQALFTPTLLDGKPVKVSGIITYNFVLQ